MAPALTLSKSRLEALSDGIFAIAMTLLALKVDAPAMSHHATNADMARELLVEAPAFIAFVATFLISGAFWFLHHITFHFIRHVSRVLCWVNLLMLMFVSLLPFSAGMVGHLFIHPVSQLIYFGNQLAIALLLNLHWHYARRKKMVASQAALAHIHQVTFRIGGIAAAFAAALAAAIFEPHYSPAAFIASLLAAWLWERGSRARKAPQWSRPELVS